MRKLEANAMAILHGAAHLLSKPQHLVHHVSHISSARFCRSIVFSHDYK
jgi:hypothetical protein